MAIDLYMPYNGDQQLTPSGDWAVITDTVDAAPASEQQIVRLMMTGPQVTDDTGLVVVQADDKFAPNWGVGIPRYLGENLVGQDEVDIQNAFMQSFTEDPNYVIVPTPYIAVDEIQPGSELDITVQVRTALGAVASVSKTIGG